MATMHCASCAKSFQPHPQTPKQTYCSTPQCQSARRRQWQRDKLQTDADYRANQVSAQRAWLARNPDIWREYREAHPEYTERNRAAQIQRNAKARSRKIAKMDMPRLSPHLPSGMYRLTLISDGEIAEMDVWTVQITVHADQNEFHREIAKR
jgi:hypothetical protein